ncbi:hypothetical protein GCM10027575_40500 [Phytohabitans suffuscus]
MIRAVQNLTVVVNCGSQVHKVRRAGSNVLHIENLLYVRNSDVIDDAGEAVWFGPVLDAGRHPMTRCGVLVGAQLGLRTHG